MPVNQQIVFFMKLTVPIFIIFLIGCYFIILGLSRKSSLYDSGIHIIGIIMCFISGSFIIVGCSTIGDKLFQ